MKKSKAKVINPPKPIRKFAPALGMVAAGILALFALLQLFRFDKFLPEFDAQMVGTGGFALFTAVMIVLCEIFAIPFLLRMRLSHFAMAISGLMALIPPWIWLMMSVWSLGESVPAIQFSTYFPWQSGVWLVVFNAIWLLFNFATVWSLGLDKLLPQRAKKLKSPTK